MPLHRLFAAVLLVWLILPAGAYAGFLTAKDIFALLPASIFDNLPPNLEEDDKGKLLTNGISDFWRITVDEPDLLVITGEPFDDREVALRLYENDLDGATIAAIGTIGEPICSVELWKLDINGRLYPIDTPAEPDIREFFIKEHANLGNIPHATLICLEKDGLAARPIFWNQHGLLEPNFDLDISYRWTGGNFEKTSRPVPREKRQRAQAIPF